MSLTGRPRLEGAIAAYCVSKTTDSRLKIVKRDATKRVVIASMEIVDRKCWHDERGGWQRTEF